LSRAEPDGSVKLDARRYQIGGAELAHGSRQRDGRLDADVVRRGADRDVKRARLDDEAHVGVEECELARIEDEANASGFAGLQVQSHEAGDHTIVVGEVLELGYQSEGKPLIFYRGGYGRYEI